MEQIATSLGRFSGRGSCEWMGLRMKDFVAIDAAHLMPGAATLLRLPESKAGRTLTSAAGLPAPAANTNATLRQLPQSSRDQKQYANSDGRWRSGAYDAAGKRALDLLLVLMALPLALPIILFASLALWLESGLPFYSQDRLGQHGKRFRIFKLRTMVRDADVRLKDFLDRDPDLRREWDETQKLKKDPRITRIGRILRMTSLDELPQLWNVFTGEMSLVGPRPMLPEQLPLYGDASAYFAVKPGITGLWQVSSRNESSFASRAQADADYLRAMGLQLDLTLIWRTVGVVAKGTGY